MSSAESCSPLAAPGMMSAIHAVGDELPEAVGWAQDLVGAEADVYEEWDSA